MGEIDVKFSHPIDASIADASIDDTFTAQQAIDQLVAAEFIEPNPHGYQLALKGGGAYTW